MRVERVPGTPIPVTDGYQSLAALLGDPGFRGAIMDGSLQAQVAGVTIAYSEGTVPATATGGQALSSGQAMTFGPVFHPEAAWRIEHIWLRRTTAGVAANISPFLAVAR